MRPRQQQVSPAAEVTETCYLDTSLPRLAKLKARALDHDQ